MTTGHKDTGSTIPEESGSAIAVKFLKLEAAANLEVAGMRLLREAQALAKLSHPNVVAACDVGVAEAAVYVAL